ASILTAIYAGFFKAAVENRHEQWGFTTRGASWLLSLRSKPLFGDCRGRTSTALYQPPWRACSLGLVALGEQNPATLAGKNSVPHRPVAPPASGAMNQIHRQDQNVCHAQQSPGSAA